ncbi:unnamed protein product [Auanema sp. JU1783]|nr:unnamed protein product [Auanema sp. JU1783]
MKMTVVGELINGGTSERDVDPSPSAIGTEFARQYYTLLAASPSSVHRFYSHESSLILNDRTIVGQQNIGRSIEELVGEACRIKITSIKGLATFNGGIVLQIFGEMSGKRFVQTFILGQQGAKKYYVQNDLFHFVDQVYACAISDTGNSTPVEPEKPKPIVNGSVRKVPEEKVVPPQVEKVSSTNDRSLNTSIEEKVHKHKHSKKDETPRKKEETPKKKEETPKKEEERAPVDDSPKTWAKLVGQSKTTVQPSSVPAPVIKAQPKPSPLKAQVNAGNTTINTRPQQPSVTTHQIYVGGIIRNIVPATTGAAEQEIRAAFSKYGTVENVAVPRKVLDNPSDMSKHGFAFVTMKTQEDIQNAIQAARKDERGHHFQIKLDSFGFDGEVLISEQKGDRERTGFRSRGGFSGRGNNFNARGGRGGRGGFRGGHSNNSGTQH